MKTRSLLKRLLVVLVLIEVPAVAGEPPALESAAPVEEASALAAVTPGLTPHFSAWLSSHGYGAYDFGRSDVAGGSTGGKTSDADAVVNQPVIFIHGNSDSALGTGALGLTGWSASIDTFRANGYKSAELYATTWGPASSLLASQQYHSKAYLTRLRAFIQAVLEYTGAAKVDIVSHSMGVTLARKAIKGGAGSDLANGGSYNLGPALTSSVDTFVGISGSNWGLVSCYQTGPGTPTCGSTNGFYPGWWYGPTGLSSFLADIDATSHYEGTYVYSIWSTVDEIIGYGDLVWGTYTSPIPGQNGEKRFTAAPYGHVNCKDLTGYNQFRMVKYHSVN